MTNKEFENMIKENSETLKNSMTVEPIEFKKRKSNKIGLGVLCVAAALVLAVNVSPKLAYATLDIPVIGSIVKVVTGGRFESNIVTPQIKGLVNKALEDKLNSEFKEHSTSVIWALEKDIEELSRDFGEDFSLGVDANYVVRTDNDDILALDTYIVNTVASSSTKHIFYNINKKTGTVIELRDLFKDGADYITPISKYIISQMEKDKDSYWLGEDGFEQIKENQNFFINDSGNIVVSFDKYEVAIGAKGCPEFEIPNEVIENILK